MAWTHVVLTLNLLMRCVNICRKQKTSRVVCMCFCVCTCPGHACIWNLDINNRTLFLNTLPCLRWGLSLNLELIDWTRLASQWALGICLITGICHKPGPLHGDLNSVTLLQHQAISQLIPPLPKTSWILSYGLNVMPTLQGLYFWFC